MMGTTSSSSMSMATALASGQSRFLEEFIRQHPPNHQLVGTPKERRHHVLAHCRNEDQQGAGDDAGQRLWQGHPHKGGDGPGTQIRGCLQQRPIVLFQIGITAAGS